MIKTKRLVVEFDRRFDRFSSDYKKNLRIEDKVSVLNEAQSKIFENRVSVAETNSEIRNDLRTFELKNTSLTKLRVEKDFSVFVLPPNLYKMLRVKCVAFKEGCGSKEIPVTIFQTDDLEQALTDDFWKPSFEWENIIGDEGSEGFYVWHQDSCRIDKVIIDYYRFPQELECASMSPTGMYRNADDTLIDFDADCEFDKTFLWQSIVDLAVLIARGDIGDQRDYQIQKDKYLLKDKIEK